ncbi:MAG: FAD:protein FMN transferase [Candidatus Omnitrophica bacterium]|nr:FAD:protein FMN transferase [Candidatus Omnitrophota bacterium]
MNRILIIGLAVIFLAQAGCGRAGTVKKTEFIMGTRVSISVPGNQLENIPAENNSAKTVFEKGFQAVREVDALLSAWRGNSQVSQLNKLKPGEKMDLDPDFGEILKTSIYLNQVTKGAFDITINPLLALWGFGAKESNNFKIPSDQEIEQCLKQVGSEKIIYDHINKQAGFKAAGMQIDLGGIAKGYAVDKAADVLKNLGIKKALIEAGGDIYCLGDGLKDRGWRIGVQHPRDKEQYLMILKLTDKAVATSGDYENYFSKDNKRYSHIIDPRTGRTVQETLMSVTIIADDCTTADALATAVFVMGPVKGLRFIESQKDIEAVIISGSQKEIKISTSSGMGKFQVR